MRSVRLPRSARAAARLMAVVVLPTPPFWFAMATIIGVRTSEGIVAGNSRIAELGESPQWRMGWRTCEVGDCVKWRFANYRVTTHPFLVRLKPGHDVLQG